MKEFTEEEYKRIYHSADRRFSILPTVLLLTGNLEGKIVLDLGCGDGFFTKPLADKGAKKVIGLDISEKQIINAKKKNLTKNTEYRVLDVFGEKLPKADVIIAPFIACFPDSVNKITAFYKNIYEALNPKGKFIGVLDYPDKGDKLKKFGAIKKLKGKAVDGSKIKIELYDNQELITTLYSHYYSQETIKNILLEVGFKKFLWKLPIVSSEGIKYFGSLFWKDYIENPGLGYLWAQKN